jgi:hypothetical protein
MIRLFVLLLVTLFCALQPCGANVVRYTDTTANTVQKFDERHLATYRAERAFNYDNTPAKGGGLMDLLGFLLNEFFESLNSVRVGKITLFDVLFYSLMVFAAVMIVMQLFKIRLSGLFSPGNNDIVQHRSFSENVHELDFETLIKNALDAGDYRLATRLYYLSILKRLSEAGLINWQKNKTNFEYYYELKGEERRKQFYDITRTFESAWYGNHEISGSDFDENLKAFMGFLQTIKR